MKGENGKPAGPHQERYRVIRLAALVGGDADNKMAAAYPCLDNEAHRCHSSKSERRRLRILGGFIQKQRNHVLRRPGLAVWLPHGTTAGIKLAVGEMVGRVSL